MSKDMEELITKYGGYLLKKTNRCNTIEEGASLILEKLKNKEALKLFQKMLVLQGVDEQTAYELCVNRNYSAVFEKKSKFTSSIKAKQAGYIKSIDALILGNTAAKLGAGRAKSGNLLIYLRIKNLIRKILKKR
jgi:pyrimidine-nucleoside phosphorylase